MSKLNDSMREFLNGRRYAILATLDEDGSIHLTPVWYLFEDERFFIGTGADRKLKNILAHPQASLIVDSRKQGSEMWISASGSAEVVRGKQSEEINARVHQRYLTEDGMEKVGTVLEAASEATICLTPNSWRSYSLKSLDDQYFGGVLGQTPEKWFLPLEV